MQPNFNIISRTFICAGFLFSFFLFFSCGSIDEKKELVEKSDTAIVDIPTLTKKITAYPKNPDLYFERSMLYFKQNDISFALSDINTALSIDSSKTPFYLHRADIYYKQQQTRLAKSDLQKALSLDPKLIQAHLKLSEIALLLKDYKNAISHANDALKIDVFNPTAYFLKGLTYKYGRDTTNAISSFQTAIEQDNQYYKAFVELGHLLTAQNNPLALDYFNNAINLQPGNIEAIYHKTYFLQTHGAPEKAKEGYSLILRIDSSDVVNNQKNYPLTYEFWYNAGLCYESLKDKKNATKMYKKALQIKEDFELAARALSRVE